MKRLHLLATAALLMSSPALAVVSVTQNNVQVPTTGTLSPFDFLNDGTNSWPLIDLFDGTTHGTFDGDGGFLAHISNSSVAVTGTFWQATQPISGTVTANAGTNLNTSLLATDAHLTALGTTALGTDAHLTAFTSANHTDLSAINTTLGSPLQGGGTVVATQSTGSNLHVQVDNTNANGQALMAASSPVVIASDQSAVAVKAASGAFVAGSIADLAHGQGTMAASVPVAIASNQSAIPASESGTWNITNISGTVSLPTGASTAALQPTNAAQGSTTSGQTGHLVQGAVTTSSPTYTTGQTSPLSLDTTGALRVNVTAGGGGGGTASSFGSAFPATGTAIGLTNGTNMVGWSAASNYGTGPGAIAVPAVNAAVTNTVAAALNTSPSLANGNGIVQTQGGSVLSATNGVYTNVLQGNAVLSATNPLFSNLSQGSAALSATNGIYSNVLQGNAALTAANGLPTAPSPYPAGSTPITASATGTTGATAATLTNVTSHTTYICGFSIRANATAAATGNATVAGTISGTLNFTQWTAPNASGIGVTEIPFAPCVPASAVSTSIVVTSAAAGTGGRRLSDGMGIFHMRRWLIALALFCLPIAAIAGLTSRDSTYNNACAIMGTCTGGGGTASPIMLQHIASSTNPTGNGIPGRAFIIPIEPVPANAVAVIFVSALASKTVSITDTLGATWTNLCSASGGTGNAKAWAFVASLGGTGGADSVTIGVGASNTQPVQYDLTIWENINTTTPSGGSHCSATNGVTPSSGVITDTGAFTPTNNNANGGNVIETYVPVCTSLAGGNTTSWTPKSGFTLLNSEIIWTNNQGFPNAVQWETQTTSASLTASITEAGDPGDCFNLATVALQVASNSQTPPSAIHVAKIIHESMVATGATVTTQQSWTGNLRVATFTWTGGCPGGGGSCLTSVTSGDGCSWTLLGGTHGGSVIAYAQNCSTEASDTLVLHLSGALGAQFSFRVYDVSNALASSFQNATTDASAACGTTWTNFPGSFTPSGASSGLAFHALGNGNGPVPTVTLSTGTTTADQWQFTGISDSDIADNSDDSDHAYYSGSPTISWSGTKTHGSDTCYYMSAAFN